MCIVKVNNNIFCFSSFEHIRSFSHIITFHFLLFSVIPTNTYVNLTAHTISPPTSDKCNVSNDSVDHLDNLACTHKLKKREEITSKNTKTRCNENDLENTSSEYCDFYPVIFVSPVYETGEEDKLTYSCSLPSTKSVTSQYNFLQSYRDYLNSPIKNPPLRSLSHPNPIITNPTYSETNSSTGTKRHRHSIAGQTTYFKMLGFNTGGPLPLKKLGGGSTNSLFSTAVISGSSSAPNLRDMIPSTASASGNLIYVVFMQPIRNLLMFLCAMLKITS